MEKTFKELLAERLETTVGWLDTNPNGSVRLSTVLEVAESYHAQHTPPQGMEEVIKRVEGLYLKDIENPLSTVSMGKLQYYNDAVYECIEIIRSTPVIKAKALRKT